MVIYQMSKEDFDSRGCGHRILHGFTINKAVAEEWKLSKGDNNFYVLSENMVDHDIADALKSVTDTILREELNAMRRKY